MKLEFIDGHGKDVSREVHTAIDDIEKFKGTAGFAHLILAANQHLSLWELQMLLYRWGTERSRSWIQRRRWMYQDAAVIRASGAQGNSDGKDSRAVAVMRANPTASIRDLVKLLGTSGIDRSREWVRRHRCDPGE